MRLLPALLLFLLALPAAAQHGGAALPSQAPPPESSQFDFLVGHWELDVQPKVSGLAAALHGAPRLAGTWSAWRALDGFGIDDELRIVDGSGNPRTLSRSLRIYDPAIRRWKITGLDVYRARVIAATATRADDGSMLVEGRSSDAQGEPQLTRTRFLDIGPDRFRLQQDRSSDNGASWDEAVLVIDATRIAATAPR